MSNLLNRGDHFVQAPELVNEESSWAYLHSHKIREMSMLDVDYKYLNLAAPSASQATGANAANSQTAKKDLPIERFAGLIDTEDARFEKQRQESLKQSTSSVAHACHAQTASLGAFYQRKAEAIESILVSQYEARDQMIHQARISQVDENHHPELVLAPWVFNNLPGTNTNQWPEGLSSFVERLDELEPLEFWTEPVDTLSQSTEFIKGARIYLENTLKTYEETKLENLCLAIRAYLGFAVKTGTSDAFIEALELIQQIEEKVPSDQAAKVNDALAIHLKRALHVVQDQYMKRNNMRYLDSQAISGVFSIAKFTSFAHQTEQNTSITTDGDYLYIYVGIQMKAVMYKIGTGMNNTIAGKIYIEKRAEKDGDVTWTYADGKLFARRAADQEAGLIYMFDAETLSALGEGKLVCGDIFSSKSASQSNSLNRFFPMFTDKENNQICIITLKVTEKQKVVKPEMESKHANYLQKMKERSKNAKMDGMFAELQDDTPELLESMFLRDLATGTLRAQDTIRDKWTIFKKHYLKMKNLFILLCANRGYPKLKQDDLFNFAKKCDIGREFYLVILKRMCKGDNSRREIQNLQLERHDFVNFLINIFVNENPNARDSPNLQDTVDRFFKHIFSCFSIPQGSKFRERLLYTTKVHELLEKNRQGLDKLFALYNKGPNNKVRMENAQNCLKKAKGPPFPKDFNIFFYETLQSEVEPKTNAADLNMNYLEFVAFICRVAHESCQQTGLSKSDLEFKIEVYLKAIFDGHDLPFQQLEGTKPKSLQKQGSLYDEFQRIQKGMDKAENLKSEIRAKRRREPPGGYEDVHEHRGGRGRGGPPGRPSRAGRRRERGREEMEESERRAADEDSDEVNDPQTYKVCQFYIHKFSVDQIAVETKTAASSPKDSSDMIQEMQEAFSGFFESEDCDTAYMDNNSDICEAAFKLASDAQENRFKMSLPLAESVLICESLVLSDRKDQELVVAEDSMLQPNSLYSGKWILNGDNLAYHQNLASSGTMIHIFSTQPSEERPLLKTPSLSKANSLVAQQMKKTKSLDPFGVRDDEDEAYEEKVLSLRQRMMDSQFNVDSIQEFGGQIQLDNFIREEQDREARLMKVDEPVESPKLAKADSFDSDSQDDMFEEIKLLGTHRHSVKNQEALNTRYAAPITYDEVHQKYYALQLCSNQRYVAVIADLHRYGEHFNAPVVQEDNKRPMSALETALFKSRAIQDVVDFQIELPESLLDFQTQAFKLLLMVEKERFMMPWRWNYWTNLYQNMLHQSHLLEDQEDDSNLTIQVKVHKIENRLQKLKVAEYESIRKEYSFEYSDEAAKELAKLSDKKQEESKPDEKPQPKRNDNPPLPRAIKNKIQAMMENESDEEEEACQPKSAFDHPPGSGLFGQPDLRAPTLTRQEGGNMNYPFVSNTGLFGGGGPPKHPHQPPQIMENTRVLPAEKILVIKEHKKIHMFCLSGSVKSLQTLINHVKSLDSVISASEGRENMNQRHKLVDLKSSILKMMVVWSTFADQMAAARESDQLILNEVREYLISVIKARDMTHRNIAWRVLIVGWNQFMRTTLVANEFIKLALQQSSEFIANNFENWLKEPKNDQVSKRQNSLYRRLLNCDSEPVTPLEMLKTRFFTVQSSFYDFECLNRSNVQLLNVMIETANFKKQVYNLGEMQGQSGETVPSLLAIRRGVLEKTFDRCFRNMKQFPISLKAIPTELKKKETSAPKGKKAKQMQQQLRTEEASDYGFILKEAPVRSFLMTTGRDSSVSSSDNMVFNSSLFAVPIGATLITDPFAVAGITSYILDIHQTNHGLDYRQRFGYHPEGEHAKAPMPQSSTIAKVYSDKKVTTKEELEQLQSDHEKAALELLDLFIDSIKETFTLEKKAPKSESRAYESPVKPKESEQVSVSELDKLLSYRSNLINVFYKMTEAALAQNLHLRSKADIRVLERILSVVLWLIQHDQDGEKLCNKWHCQEITSLISVLIENVSLSMMSQQSSVAQIGYNLLPGINEIIAAIQLMFTATEDPEKPVWNLLTCLQTFNTEGIDFSKERVFETPHPYPSGDYALSETIEVSKAVGFMVEFDKRCQSESNHDVLTINSGSDPNYSVNANFVTNLSMYSQKPHTAIPYFLLGSRMKVTFNVPGRRGGRYRDDPRYRGGGGGPNQSKKVTDHRWGYKIFIRPIFGEPQNTIIQDIKGHKEAVYAQLGGELNCHKLELALNQLVCMASQFSRELANLDRFHWQVGDTVAVSSSSRTIQSIAKLVKQPIFRGGLMNPSLILGSQSENEKNLSITLQTTAAETKNFNKIISGEIDLIQRFKECRLVDLRRKMEQEEKKEEPKKEQTKAVLYEPKLNQWSKTVSDHVSYKDGQLSFSTDIDATYSKIRQMVKWQQVTNMQFMRPSARKHLGSWQALEKLLLVVTLQQTQSLDLVSQFASFQQPDPKSSNASVVSAGYDEVKFLHDSLKLLGTQMNQLIDWLIQRVQGETKTQQMIDSILDLAQSKIDEKLVKLKDQEAERKRVTKEQSEKLKKAMEDEMKEAESKEDEEVSQISEQKPKKPEKKDDGPKVAVAKAKGRGGKRAVVHRAMNLNKAKPAKDKKKADAKKNEKDEEAKKEEKQQKAEPKEESKFLDLTLAQVNELKNEIENESFEVFLSTYSGDGAEPKNLLPFCKLFNIKLNEEDPVETIRAIFKRIKGRLAQIIDLDTKDIQLLKKVDGEELRAQFREEPFAEVLKDVRSRLLVLLEVKPSLHFTQNVIKSGHKRPNIEDKIKQAEIDKGSQQDSEFFEHPHELADINEEDDDEDLQPLPVGRSQSQQVGTKLPKAIPKLAKKSMSGVEGKKDLSVKSYNKEKDSENNEFTELKRLWDKWRRAHARSEEPKDSPVYQVLQLAKNTEISGDLNMISRALCEHSKRAAFRIFALKQQQRLCESLINTPYQRMIWGNQSHALNNSGLDRIEASGEELTHTVNQGVKGLVVQLMKCVIRESNDIKYYSDLLLKNIVSSQQSSSGNGQSQAQQNKKESSAQHKSEKPKKEKRHSNDRRSKQIGVAEYTAVKIKTVLHSVNDLRVMLGDPTTQVCVLDTLRAELLQKMQEEEKEPFDILKHFLISLIEIVLQCHSGSLLSDIIPGAKNLCNTAFKVAKILLANILQDKQQLMEPETAITMQEMMVEILLKHLERACGIKVGENDEPVINKADANIDEIVQLLRLLQEMMRIQSETAKLTDGSVHVPDSQSQSKYGGQSMMSARQSCFLQEGSKSVMRMSRLLTYLLIDFEVPAVVKAAVRCARPFFFGLVDFQKLKPYCNQTQGKIMSQNAYLSASLRKIGERISSFEQKEKEEKAKEDEKYVVYANINNQQEDFTFLLTALYHWEERHPVIGPSQSTKPVPSKQMKKKESVKLNKKKSSLEKEPENVQKLLTAAQEALDSCSPDDFKMLKALRVPAKPLVTCFTALLHLLAGIDPGIPVDKRGKVKTDKPWNIALQLMGSAQGFVDTLSSFKTHIDEDKVKTLNFEQIKTILKDEDFNSEKLSKISSVGASICTWIINMNDYYWLVQREKVKKKVPIKGDHKPKDEADNKKEQEEPKPDEPPKEEAKYEEEVEEEEQQDELDNEEEAKLQEAIALSIQNQEQKPEEAKEGENKPDEPKNEEQKEEVKDAEKPDAEEPPKEVVEEAKGEDQEPKPEEVKDEPKPEEHKEEVKADPVPEENKEEAKADPQPEENKEEAKADPLPEENKEEAKEDAVPEEDKEEAKAEPKPEENKEEVKANPQPEENNEEAKADPLPEENKEEVKDEAKPGENKEEAKDEAKLEENKEEAKAEDKPAEEAKQEAPAEEVKKEQIVEEVKQEPVETEEEKQAREAEEKAAKEKELLAKADESHGKAYKLVNALKKDDFVITKSMKNPTAVVITTMKMTCLFLDEKPAAEVEEGEKNENEDMKFFVHASKTFLSDWEQFKDRMKDFEQEKISEETAKQVKEIMDSDAISFDKARQCSELITAIYRWCESLLAVHEYIKVVGAELFLEQKEKRIKEEKAREEERKILQESYKLNRLKNELQEQVDKVQGELDKLEGAKELHQQYAAQLTKYVESVIKQLVNSGKEPYTKENLSKIKMDDKDSFKSMVEALAEKAQIEFVNAETLFMTSALIKDKVASEANAVQSKGKADEANASASKKTTKSYTIGSGDTAHEITLIDNKVLLMQPSNILQSQLESKDNTQKPSIHQLLSTYLEVFKASNEVIYVDDTPEEMERKLKVKNFNERIVHHLFQAFHIANQLQQRYSVPITQAMSHQEATEFAQLLQQAYNGELEPVIQNPNLSPDQLKKEVMNGKQIKDYFPFTLKTVKANTPFQEKPPGWATPVVFCQPQLVTTLMTVSYSSDIEKLLETKQTLLKGLDRNPADAFKLSINKGSARKRQGQAVSSCILSNIRILRELLVGKSESQIRSLSRAKTRLKVVTKKKDELIEDDVSIHSLQGSAKMERQESVRQINTVPGSKHEQRQQEMAKLINDSLQLLKISKWQDITDSDKQLILGLFAVVGGWQGFSKIVAGSPVTVEMSRGQWSQATIIDEGSGQRKASVILDEDTSLNVVKVAHDKIMPQQTNIDKRVAEQLNFDDLCSAMTFLHKQVVEKEKGQVSIGHAMKSELVIIQMLLNVCSKLNWSKIDQRSTGFHQFRQMLMQVTQQNSNVVNEDMAMEYLEKQLIEAWERTIDRSEDRNNDFYAMRDYLGTDDSLVDEDLSKNFTASVDEQKNQKDEAKKSYDQDIYNQPPSSYFSGLPEAQITKNTKQRALRMLSWWDKLVIFPTIEFVRNQFRPYEITYTMETYREALRNGDMEAAKQNAMITWENRVPETVTLPSERHDWNAKVTDECIVDSWALAKISKIPSAYITTAAIQRANTQLSNLMDQSSSLIIRLQSLGLTQIVVQIKLIDSRYNVVLCEFFDAENECSHLIWLPTSLLYEMPSQLRPRTSGYSKKRVCVEYLQAVNSIISLFARKTLLQFFLSSQSQSDRALDSLSQTFGDNLRLHQLIQWSVLEQYASSPFKGWIEDLRSCLPIKNTDKADKFAVSAKTSMTQLMEEVSDQIVQEKLKEGTKVDLAEDVEDESKTSSSGESALDLISSLINSCVQRIAGGEKADGPNHKMVHDLIEWTTKNWEICNKVTSRYKVCDLCDQGTSSEQLIPLHDLLRSADGEQEAASAIATLVMFNKEGCKMSPSSKIEFYSDSKQANLVNEIKAGSENTKSHGPILLNFGQAWAKVQPGCLALLSLFDQQDEIKQSMPCVIFQIPKQWSVVCWLTDKLTTALLQCGNSKEAIEIGSLIFGRVMGALTTFYETTNAPQMVKSQVLSLLTRNMLKLRHILRKTQVGEETLNLSSEKHLEKLYLGDAFMKKLINDIDSARKVELKEAYEQATSQKDQKLYSAFLQDAIEFLMTVIIPINKDSQQSSYSDILKLADDKESLKNWLDPLMRTSQFVHFFNNEITTLPQDLLREVHSATKLENQEPIQQIVVLDKLPRNDKYPKSWLIKQIIDQVNYHHGRILNPTTDITFTESTCPDEKNPFVHRDCYRVVVLLDGWDHMKPLPDFVEFYETVKMQAPKTVDKMPREDYYQAAFKNTDLDEDTDEGGEDDEAATKKAQEKAKKEREEADFQAKLNHPETWSCPICTFENPVSATLCDMCQSGNKPPEAELLEQWKEKLMAKRREEAAADEQIPDQAPKGERPEKVLTANDVRLKWLAYDLQRIIRREQRRVYQKKEKAELERIRVKKEAEEKERREKEEAERIEKERLAKEAKEKEEAEKREAEIREKEAKAAAKLKEKEDKKAERKEKKKKGKKGKKAKADKPEEPKEEVKEEAKQEEKPKEEQKNDQPPKDEKEKQPEPLVAADEGDDESVEHDKEPPYGDEEEWRDEEEVPEHIQRWIEEAGDDPKAKKLAELGHDPAILREEPQFAEILLQTAFEEENKQKEEKERKQKQKEQEEEAKRKAEAKAEEKKKAQELRKNEDFKLIKEPTIDLSCLVGLDQIEDNEKAKAAVVEMLNKRVLDKDGLLNQRAAEVFEQIHQAFQQPEELLMFPEDGTVVSTMEDYGLTKSGIKEMELEVFKELCLTIANADSLVLFKFLQSQGYDVWLEQRAYSTILPAAHNWTNVESSDMNLIDKGTIEQIKEFVEISLCDAEKVVNNMEAYQIRLMSKIDQSNVTNYIHGVVDLADKPLEEKKNPFVQDDQIVEKEEPKQPEEEEEKREVDINPLMVPHGYYNEDYFLTRAEKAQVQSNRPHWYITSNLPAISYSWALIRSFSKYFALAVPFINYSSRIAEVPKQEFLQVSLASYMASLRTLCLSNTKYELKFLILEKTAIDPEKIHSLTFERLSLASKADAKEEGKQEEEEQKTEKKKVISERREFMFMQAYEQLKDIDPSNLRPKMPKGTDPHLSFHIKFAGEHVEGFDGPYRQFFTDITQELLYVKLDDKAEANNEDNAEEDQAQDKSDEISSAVTKVYLGLLIASRNMIRKAPVGKDKFAINPKFDSQANLALYTMLGVLFGVCVRTSPVICTNLPQIVWKQLVGQRINIDDLNEFDDGIQAEIKPLIECKKEEFNELFGERFFTTYLSDGTQVELEEGGAERDLTYENRLEYAKRTLYVRMNECSKQCEAIRQGICQIVPEALLNMVSATELEEWIYGRKHIDVELLRRHTEYKGIYQSDEGKQQIEWFWQFLTEQPQDIRREFIQFCYAQPTIPANDEEFERQKKRFKIIPPQDEQGDPDLRLIKASTCFFNMQLPRYSSYEILKDKILKAIVMDNVTLNAEAQGNDDNIHRDDVSDHSEMSGMGGGGEEEEEEE